MPNRLREPATRFAAGTDKYILVQRVAPSYDLVLDIVDAATGQLARTVVIALPLRRVDGSASGSFFDGCITSRTAQRAACSVDRREVVVVDLDAGRVLSRFKLESVRAAPSSDGFWLHARALDDGGYANLVVSVGPNGEERWRARTNTLVDVIPGTAVMPVVAGPNEPEYGAKYPTQFRRDTDGRSLLGVSQWSSPSWSPFIGGFAVEGQVVRRPVVDTSVDSYDTNGEQISSIKDEFGNPEPWSMVSVNLFADSALDSQAPAPSRPFIKRIKAGEGAPRSVDVAAVDPGSGRILWIRTLTGAGAFGASSSGAGTAAMFCLLKTEGPKPCGFADLATDAAGVWDKRVLDPELLAFDGKNMLVSYREQKNGDRWVAAVTVDQSGVAKTLWTHNYGTGEVPRVFGGKIYLGLRRIL